MSVVCSFDVGIRNLGYAILTKNSDNEVIEVTDLGLIDVLEEPQPQLCQTIIKSGKHKGAACGKSASWYIGGDDGGESYCKMHGKKIKVGTVKAIKKTKHAKNISIQDMSIAIIKSLDSHDFHKIATTVLIEQQPGRATQRVKIASYIIYSYYMLRGVLGSEGSILKEVRLVSPQRKLRMYTGPPFKFSPTITSTDEFTLKEPTAKSNKKYKMRKMLGEAHIMRILKYPGNCVFMVNCPEHVLAKYEALHKKDDVSDAFLQGLSAFITKASKTVKKKTNTIVNNGKRKRTPRRISRRKISSRDDGSTSTTNG